MNLQKKWFTLVEIMFVVAIISLVAITFWKLSISSWTDNKLASFTNKVVAKIDYAKNSSLTWKGYLSWSSVQIPTNWDVILTTTWNGSIKIDTNINELDETLQQWDKDKINAIYCLSNSYEKSYNPKQVDLVNQKITANKVTTATIKFEWRESKIITNPAKDCKWLIVETSFNNWTDNIVKQIFTYNKLSWVIDRWPTCNYNSLQDYCK